MTTKTKQPQTLKEKLAAIKEQIADSTNIVELDEVSEVLYDLYFKNGKDKSIMKFYNEIIERSNEHAGYKRWAELTEKSKQPRVMAEEPADFGKPKKKKVPQPEVEEDLMGDDEEEDLMGDSKPAPKKSNKKAPAGKPTTGQRVKAIIEGDKKNKLGFKDVAKLLKDEGYSFSDNSVRWYISKARKGEL